MSRYLLIDISNSFTKIAWSDGENISRVRRIPTPDLNAKSLGAVLPKNSSPAAASVCCVVPSKMAGVRRALKNIPLIEISASIDLGIGIQYPHPSQIGPDRLANAVAARYLHGSPCVVVDFGTAVTFDVISKCGEYLGGVIAPGLNAMTSYLHEKTALLPKIRLEEPPNAVGKSTREAMLAGAVYGYRGLIQGIVEEIVKSEFSGKRCLLVATGGDAELIAGNVSIFDGIDPLLTLHGLRLIALRHFSEKSRR